MRLMSGRFFSEGEWGKNLALVSEKTAMVPLLEAASTFPVTVPSGVKGLLAVPKLDGFTSWAPKSLPM